MSFFLRNIGIFTHEQQTRLQQASVAIAGVGGVGGIMVERLVRMGVGRVSIADPDSFEPSNINRQFASSQRTLGKNKAAVLAEQLCQINPALIVHSYSEGVTTENCEAFIADADVVVDEVDYSCFAISRLLHTKARALGKYSVFANAVGFGATLFIFDPHGMSFDEYFHNEDATQSIFPLDQMCPAFPSYLSESAVQALMHGEGGYIPTVSIGCALAGALVATEVVAVLLGLRPAAVVPAVTRLDLLDRRLETLTQERTAL